MLKQHEWWQINRFVHHVFVVVFDTSDGCFGGAIRGAGNYSSNSSGTCVNPYNFFDICRTLVHCALANLHRLYEELVELARDTT